VVNEPMSKLIREERDFIHDISNTLAVCFLLTDILGEATTSPDLEILKSTLQKLEAQLKTRRAILIERSSQP
jgi:hypothetical protein